MGVVQKRMGSLVVRSTTERISGVSPCKEKRYDFVLKEGQMTGLTLRSCPVLNMSMVRSSKVKENVGSL